MKALRPLALLCLLASAAVAAQRRVEPVSLTVPSAGGAQQSQRGAQPIPEVRLQDARVLGEPRAAEANVLEAAAPPQQIAAADAFAPAQAGRGDPAGMLEAVRDHAQRPQAGGYEFERLQDRWFEKRGAAARAPPEEPLERLRTVRAAPALAPHDLSARSGEGVDELTRGMRRLSQSDALTGLPGRLFLAGNLPELMEGKKTLISFKLDYLKEINDAYGHEAGDLALKSVAAIAAELFGDAAEPIRRSPVGFVAFYEGDLEQARYAAEALRLAIFRRLHPARRWLAREDESRMPGTVSIGVAAIEPSPSVKESYESALSRAETAREWAKREGGDRVAVFDGRARAGDRLEARDLRPFMRRQRHGRRLMDRLNSLEPDASKVIARRDAAAQAREAALEASMGPELRKTMRDRRQTNPLTGLPSAAWLYGNASFLAQTASHVAFFDLDNFGRVNAAVGDESRGDEIIRQFAEIIKEQAERHGAIVAHPSGEEVHEYMPRGADPRPAVEAARKAVGEQLGKRAATLGIVDERGKPFSVSASVGVAPIDRDIDPKEAVRLAVKNAESALQRAKDEGRDRMAVHGEATPWPRRLWSAFVRLISRQRERLSPPPSRDRRFLDNSIKSREEAARIVGYDALSESGRPAGEFSHGGVRIVGGDGRPEVVVKRFAHKMGEEFISSELFVRGVIEAFELFNRHLVAPRAVAVISWGRLRGLVMERLRGRVVKDPPMRLAQRAALAVLALTFGISDLNGGTALTHGDQTSFLDFEKARYETGAGFARASALWTPGVAYGDYERDYEPVIAVWEESFRRQQVQDELLRIMRRSGISEERIVEDLARFRRNVGRLRKLIKAGVAEGNRRFEERLRVENLISPMRAGASDLAVQGRALSEVNRRLDGGDPALREVLRSAAAKDGTPEPSHYAGLHEIQRFVRSPDRREAILRAASEGRLGGAGGRLIAPHEAAAAYDFLRSLLAL